MVKKLGKAARSRTGRTIGLVISALTAVMLLIWLWMPGWGAISNDAQTKLGIALTHAASSAEICDAIDANTTLVSATAGTATASKALILDASSIIDSVGTVTTVTAKAIAGGDNSLGITGQTQVTDTTGGVVVITGAVSTGTGLGGAASLIGGDASGTGNGGPVTVRGGATTGGLTGAGGTVTITGGANGNTTNGAGGAITFTGGAGKGSGNGGVCSFSAGAGGATGSGALLALRGGASAGASGTAGAVDIDTGAANGGTASTLSIGITNASAITIGKSGIKTALAGQALPIATAGTKTLHGIPITIVFEPTIGETLTYTVPTGYDLRVLNAVGWKTVAAAAAGDTWDLKNNDGTAANIFAQEAIGTATLADKAMAQFDSLDDAEDEVEAGNTLDLVAAEATSADGIIYVTGILKVAD